MILFFVPQNNILNPYYGVQGHTCIHITCPILYSSPSCSLNSNHIKLILVFQSNMLFPTSGAPHMPILNPGIVIPISFTWIILTVLSGLRLNTILFGKTVMCFHFILEFVNSCIIPNLFFVELIILLIICCFHILTKIVKSI